MKSLNLITDIAIGSMVSVERYKKKITSLFKKVVPILIPVQTTLQNPVSLGTASGFAVIAGYSITNKGATTINGDIGLCPGKVMEGFPPGLLIGNQNINDPISIHAKLDLMTAFDDISKRTCSDIVTLPEKIGELTLTPGLYKTDDSLSISSGNFVFDAKGNGNAIFIIQIPGSLNISMGCNIILIGGAFACNIFWQIGKTVSLGTVSVFRGTVLAMQSIKFKTGATLNGRALAINGGVKLISNSIYKHEPCPK
ncbi:MAG: hypothetical protein A2275_09810 [Bacteroidetes bacterium RIFOXYA12_FULL_35_11]|nr:MAG: hypothetical protein A2X01_02110 [Bacteroidetes bacterium GWF2_35_48]OFY82348.1 MAG: hypothetical protein A2275_09810 [Bacteroidetes bacterium RIFOXYA12_FULL_35_11]OFY98728.1 MAG: hypothetical protein A2491_01890 [Bacteroidetes bacterium RIFOXYC12_FULL_35_7]HBX49606.1 hypothetical protein [Bacteroidales bacterium]